MKPLLLRIAASVSAVACFVTFEVSANEFRTLTNADGRSIRAMVLKVEAGTASVRLEDGRQFDISLDTLTEADQEWLKEWKPSPLASEGGVTADAINKAIGHELFVDRQLWDSDPSEVAERLEWPRESKTTIAESFRFYPDDDYRFLGARPHSAALYGEEGKVTRLSIVFANKGDSYSTSGRGEMHFIQGEPVPGGMEGVKALMEHDSKTIGEALTSLLGESNRQRFGDGESRVSVDRWDWVGHALLLSSVEDEYVSLAVETIEFANSHGRIARVSDSVVRERVRGFIEERDNGDVVITNIPMVDQGPKGYCVPATVERCMRFFGIPADMYQLAMVGETQAGGGTSVDELLSNIGRDIKRKGRSFDSKSGEMKMRDIKRSIDRSIPLIWILCSTDEFNAIADARTYARKNAPWEAYVEALSEAAESRTLGHDLSRNHVVIIMGYNETTNEIAFSDSWGEAYLERWITLPEAERVSLQRFYTIEP